MAFLTLLTSFHSYQKVEKRGKERRHPAGLNRQFRIQALHFRDAFSKKAL